MVDIRKLVADRVGFAESNQLDPTEVLLRGERNKVSAFNARTAPDDGTGVKCKVCRGDGLIGVLGRNDRFAVAQCKCFGTRQTVQRLQRAGIWERAKKCRLEDFKIDTPTRKAMRELVEGYIENPGGHWLCLCGQSGCGKTHLCTAAFVQLSYRLGLDGRYFVWNADGRALKATAMDDSSALWEAIKTTPLLYIDDLFKGGADPSDADIRLAFEILDYRYNNALLTIVSSEKLFAQLLRIDEAIAGRIKERCGSYLVSVAPDVRKNFRLSPA